ncbi:MAG: ATP-binding protein [Candidatus Methanoperedens sp.]|nr:ATP-binding protein [Candidatus Methanoperedens sp.]
MLKDKLNKIIGGGLVKRFIIGTVAIIVLFDVLTAIFMQIDLDRTLSEELNGRGEILSRHLAEESSGALLKEDTANLSQLAENIKKADRDVKYVYITDVQDNVIAQTYPFYNMDDKSSGFIDFKSQMLGGGKGFVHVVMDRTSIDEKITRQTYILIINIFIEGVLGVLMAYIAGSYLTRPMRSLVKGAEEIGKGNLGYKIELGSTGDEIQTLSDAFNQMSHSLKEKDNLEKQLLQADKLATVGQLAAGVAHEINNPLGNISLYTQMLLKKTADDATKDKLMVINDEANRAANIVKGLLDFARQSELKLTPIDINKEIGKVLSILTPQLKDIKVKTAFEPLPPILADSGQIQQVIMNLLANSIQSIIENGEIIIKTSAKQDHVEISISDNGCGIPKENLDKIFDPFFTTKEQGKGTGLGLSISYGIIKRHSGSIEVQSEAGKGTTFIIKLPGLIS